MEWLYRLAMLCGACVLMIACARVIAEPGGAPKALIRAEALVVGSGFVVWVTVGRPAAQWATLLELFLWMALAVPCLVLWVLSTPPTLPPVADTEQPKQPTYDATRARYLRAKYASRTRTR